MKEKFDRSKSRKNMRELAQEIYDRKTADVTPEEKEQYNKELKECVYKSAFRGNPNVQKVEIIDDIIVLHMRPFTQLPMPINLTKSNFIVETNFEENIICYDEHGNIFYSNVSSNEEAKDLILKLNKEGIEAVIGTPAPAINQKGEIESLKNSGIIGIYIVPELEKEQVFQNINKKS